MSAMEFTSIGSATVKRLTKKAVLVELHDRETNVWVPLSVISTDCLAHCAEGWVYDRLRVETWFAEKEDLA